MNSRTQNMLGKKKGLQNEDLQCILAFGPQALGTDYMSSSMQDNSKMVHVGICAAQSDRSL